MFVCVIEIDSTPPPIVTLTPSTIILCAATAIDCSPEEQNLLIVVPGTVTGHPPAIATFLPIL